MNLSIVVPTYKKYNQLTDFEKLSINKLYKLYDKKYDIFLMCPDYFNISDYIEILPNLKKICIDSKWFSNIKSYSDFMCRPDIYKILTNMGYDWMFLYQLDAYIFYDNINYFIELGYDYCGSPWLECLLGNGVGNGGCCIRKLDKFLYITENYVNTGYNEYGQYIPEDQWFCIIHRDKLNIMPPDIACKFSLCSESPQHYFNSELPMCAHKLFEHKHQAEYYFTKYINR